MSLRYFPQSTLSYPAMHLYLYTFLHWLTGGGVLLRNAQAFFRLRLSLDAILRHEDLQDSWGKWFGGR